MIFLPRLNFRMLLIQCLRLGKPCAYLHLYLGIHKEERARNPALFWVSIQTHHNLILPRYSKFCLILFPNHLSLILCDLYPSIHNFLFSAVYFETMVSFQVQKLGQLVKNDIVHNLMILLYRYGNLIRLIKDGSQLQSWLCLVTTVIRSILLLGHQTLAGRELSNCSRKHR